MGEFIYVFDKDARDKLLKMGYVMLRCDDEQEQYVFVNDRRRTFQEEDFSYVLSQTLTF